MMYKALLFDFDGTFADTAHDLIGSANYIFDKYNKTNISYQEGRAVASDGSQAILKLRFDPLTPTIDKAVQELFVFSARKANISVILVTQNLFQTSKFNMTIRKNTG